MTEQVGQIPEEAGSEARVQVDGNIWLQPKLAASGAA